MAVPSAPRTSSIGSAARSTSSPKWASAASGIGARLLHRSCSSSTPAMKPSASSGRIGVGPAEPMQAATSRRPGQIDSASEQTAMTIALREPILANCCGPSAGGMWNAAISSSSARQFRFGPVTNSCTAIRRVAAPDASSISASDANSGGSPVPRGRRGPEVAADGPAVAELEATPTGARRSRVQAGGPGAVDQPGRDSGATRRRPLSGPKSVSSGSG